MSDALVPQVVEKPFARSYIKYPSVHQSLLNNPSYTPPMVKAAYGFPASLTGVGSTIGFIELGGGFKQRDLDDYFKRLNLPSPRVSFVSIGGAANKTGSDADGEVMLDLCVAIGVAPGIKPVVYGAPNTFKGFSDAINKAIADKVDMISISWGAPEDAWPSGRMEKSLAAAEAAGINVYAASGDSGSGDGEAGTHVDYPSSSPHVIACGGTSLRIQNGLKVSETVWNDGSQGGATGGGYSAEYVKPVYQPTRVGRTRGVPDVAAVADPNTGWIIMLNGQLQVLGGTSAVAPFFAAINALMNQFFNRKIGNIASKFYQHTPCFNDIVSGNNGTYMAKSGWDPCTGLGSPNGKALLVALK